MNHIATGTAPSLDGELLPPHGSSSGDEDGGGDGSSVDGEAFRGHFPVRQGAGTETPVPQILASRWRRLWMVSVGFVLRNRVFATEALNRRKGSVRRSKGRRHHRLARPGPGPRRPIIWGL